MNAPTKKTSLEELEAELAHQDEELEAAIAALAAGTRGRQALAPSFFDDLEALRIRPRSKPPALPQPNLYAGLRA